MRIPPTFVGGTFIPDLLAERKLMLKILYTVFGVGVVTLYTAAAMLGWEIGGGSRRQLPPDARQNGYRSFHFWHYGLHGGK